MGAEGGKVGQVKLCKKLAARIARWRARSWTDTREVVMQAYACAMMRWDWESAAEFARQADECTLNVQRWEARAKRLEAQP